MSLENQIRMSPGQMRDRSNQYKNEAEEINTVIGKLTSLINQLQTEWEGSASVSFANQYEQLKPSFINMKDLVLQIADQLQKTATIYEHNDNELARQYGVK